VKIRIWLLSLLAVGLMSLSVPLSAQQPLEGAWLVTEQAGERTFASWLRITHQEGVGWKALYLHRGGHPMPCDVIVQGNRVEIQMVPESHYEGDRNGPWPKLSGTLDGDILRGTGASGERSFTWEARRAPDRMEGQDRTVTWGEPLRLFNGRDLTGWEPADSRSSKWQAADGILVNQASGANLRTSATFRDFKLHIEFRIPPGSNSGIYLRGRYESQVADDYGKEPFTRMVGGIYGQIAPVVNATKPAGEWNILDVTLIGYRVWIVLNGQTTVDGQLIGGITGGALDCDEQAPGPILLQGDHGPVEYRNIVLTPAR